jgi:hypothetical protein
MSITDFVKECTNRTYNLPTGTMFYDQFGGSISQSIFIKRISDDGEFQVSISKTCKAFKLN